MGGTKTFSLLGAVAAGVMMVSTGGFAADMALKARPYVAPIFTWTGCYVGVSGGVMPPESSSVPVSGDPVLTDSQNLGNVPRSLSPSDSSRTGYLIGGTAGCNYQVDRWVFSVETDLSHVDSIERSVSVTQGPAIVTTTFSQDLKYFGTLRGRLGYAFDTLLVYGTGGLAYGEVETSARIGNAAATSILSGSQSKTQLGYTVGGGLEWAFTQNWSLKGEYLYYNLGDERLSINAIVGPAETANFDYETKGHIVRAGLNYRF